MPMGKAQAFLLAGHFIERLSKATWLPARNVRLDRGPCGSGGQSAAEVN